ncbi:hypothetical protein HK099_007884 [Clydaea vesicula]|uniref:Uncharacterized protein n=1 Tax=Clydaea vesicula TaxID=447962 RepID=A0AAD5XY82_9FUNG|nr:hypothetical protein HK099_007884 [Clydaea vesicula]
MNTTFNLLQQLKEQKSLPIEFDLLNSKHQKTEMSELSELPEYSNLLNALSHMNDTELISTLENIRESVQHDMTENQKEIDNEESGNVCNGLEKQQFLLNKEQEEASAIKYLDMIRLKHSEGAKKLALLESYRETQLAEKLKMQQKIEALDEATKELKLMEELVGALKDLKEDHVEGKSNLILSVDQLQLLKSSSNEEGSNDFNNLTKSLDMLAGIQLKDKKIEELKAKIDNLENCKTALISKRDSFLDLIKDPVAQQPVQVLEQQTSQILELTKSEISNLEKKQTLLTILSGSDLNFNLSDDEGVNNNEEEIVDNLMKRLTAASTTTDHAETEKVLLTKENEVVIDGVTDNVKNSESSEVGNKEEVIYEEEELTTDESLVSTADKMKETLVKIRAGIEQIMANLSEMDKFVPESESEKENVELLRQGLHRQLNEMHDIEDQILNYIQVIEEVPSNIKEVMQSESEDNDAVGDEETIICKHGNRSVVGKEDLIPSEGPSVSKDQYKIKNVLQLDKFTNPLVEITGEEWKESAEINELEYENEDVDEDTNLKGLFDLNKDKVYKGAANMISHHEKDPYFLLQVFKEVSKLNTGYLKQKFLLLLDEINNVPPFVEGDEEYFSENITEQDDCYGKGKEFVDFVKNSAENSQICGGVILNQSRQRIKKNENKLQQHGVEDRYSKVPVVKKFLPEETTIDELTAIKLNLKKYVENLNTKRFTKAQVLELKEIFLNLLFKDAIKSTLSATNKNIKQQVLLKEKKKLLKLTEKQFDYLLEKYFNRSISKQKEKLFREMDTFASEVFFELKNFYNFEYEEEKLNEESDSETTDDEDDNDYDSSADEEVDEIKLTFERAKAWREFGLPKK